MKKVPNKRAIPLLILMFFIICADKALAFAPVVIRSAQFVDGLPLPAHHGVFVKIQPIEDPNLTAFKVSLSSDGGQTWKVYDDNLKPYNAEAINLIYRGSQYAFMTEKNYKIKVCAVYGTKGEECGEANIRLPHITASRTTDGDGDKLSQEFEYNYGLDPLNPDSDNDDMSDRVELANSLDPNLTELPVLEIATKSYNFGSGNPFGDGPNQHQALILKNSGRRPLRLFNVLVESQSNDTFQLADSFKMISNIPPGNEIGLNIDFLPKVPGLATGKVVVLTDDRAHFPENVSLTGTGKDIANMEVDWSGQPIDFGSANVGDTLQGQSLSIANINSDTPLKVGAFIKNAISFLVTPTSFMIPSGEKRDVEVLFIPDWSGTHEGVLRIQGENDASFGIVEIPLKGSATGDPPQARANTGIVRFPPTKVGDSQEAFIMIYNDGEGFLFVKTIDLGVDENIFQFLKASRVFTPSSRQMVVPPKSSRPVRITFRPQSAKTYESQLCIVTNDPKISLSQGCDTIRSIGGGVMLPQEAISIQLRGEGRQ